MNYVVQIVALAALAGTTPTRVTYSAENDHAAVDLARDKFTPHEDGGDYDITIEALEVGPLVKVWVETPGDSSGKFEDRPRPIGEICAFSVRHEPAEHRRKAVDEARTEAEAEATREALREEGRAEVRAEMAAKGSSK